MNCVLTSYPTSTIYPTEVLIHTDDQIYKGRLKKGKVILHREVLATGDIQGETKCDGVQRVGI